MDDEMAMMEKMKVWRLVERPQGARLMKAGWTYADKFNAEGTLEKHKARLVANGFTQIPGVDFFQSYAA